MWVLKDNENEYLGRDLHPTEDIKKALKFYTSRDANEARLILNGCNIFPEFKLQGIKEVEA